MPKRKKDEVDRRIAEVGRLRVRGMPVAEIARRFNISERQIRYDWRQWLGRRNADRGPGGLQGEEILAEYEELVRSAWRDYEHLGRQATSLDPKIARAKSELLRILVTVIDRKATLLGLSSATQGVGRTVAGPGPDGHEGGSPRSLNSMTDVVPLVEEALADVGCIEDPAVRSRLRARLAEVALKVREKVDLERRVAALEEIRGGGRKS